MFFSPLRRQGYDRIADDLHCSPGSTFAAAEQGLAAVGWSPRRGRLGRRRQLQVAVTFSSSPKPTDTPRQVHFLLGTGPIFMSLDHGHA